MELRPRRAKIAETVDRGTCTRTAIAHAVKRSWRAATIAATRAAGVRRGWCCGADERSAMAAAPPCRWRASHLYAVRTALPAAAAAAATGHCSPRICGVV